MNSDSFRSMLLAGDWATLPFEKPQTSQEAGPPRPDRRATGATQPAFQDASAPALAATVGEKVQAWEGNEAFLLEDLEQRVKAARTTELDELVQQDG